MFVSVYVEFIVTSPPDSVIVTFVPATKSNASLEASVLPPAVTPLHVLVSVSVTVLVNVILSPLLATLRPVPASNTTSSVPLPEPPAVYLIFSLIFLVGKDSMFWCTI